MDQETKELDRKFGNAALRFVKDDALDDAMTALAEWLDGQPSPVDADLWADDPENLRDFFRQWADKNPGSAKPRPAVDHAKANGLSWKRGS